MLVILISAFTLAGRPTTVYKPYEARINVFEGKGGTEIVVEDMKVWENGPPPRNFAILSIVEDERPGR